VPNSSAVCRNWRDARRSLADLWPIKVKGSHGRLYFGEEFTTLKDRKKEIGSDLLAKMCRDLNIDPHDL
jgi:hypothetical protein